MGVRIGPWSYRQFDKVCKSGDVASLEKHRYAILNASREQTGSYVREVLFSYSASNVWFFQARKWSSTDLRLLFSTHWNECREDPRPLLHTLTPGHAAMEPVELIHWLWLLPPRAIVNHDLKNYMIMFDYDDIRERPSAIAQRFYRDGLSSSSPYMPIVLDGWSKKQPMLSTMLRYGYFGYYDTSEYPFDRLFLKGLREHPEDIVCLYLLHRLAHRSDADQLQPFAGLSKIFEKPSPFSTIFHTHFQGLVQAMEFRMPAIQNLPCWEQWNAAKMQLTHSMPSVQVLIDHLHSEVLLLTQSIAQSSMLELDWSDYDSTSNSP